MQKTDLIHVPSYRKKEREIQPGYFILEAKCVPCLNWSLIKFIVFDSLTKVSRVSQLKSFLLCHLLLSSAACFILSKLRPSSLPLSRFHYQKLRCTRAGGGEPVAYFVFSRQIQSVIRYLSLDFKGRTSPCCINAAIDETWLIEQ